MRSRLLTVIALAGGLAAGSACGGGENGASPIRLALDFQPNAVHAGIYMAPDGLEVRIPSASSDSIRLLAAGRADLAVVDIHDLALARERGRDLVGVGALVQRPLAAVIARRGIRRPRDLAGRRVGVTGLPSDDAVLRAVLESDGASLSDVSRVTIGFSAVPSLIARRVDAVVAFWNAEGVTLRRRGVATREFRVDRYGAPRYPELVVATTRETLEGRPELVRDGLAKLREGTRRALSRPAAAVERIATVSSEDEAVVRAQLRALAPAFRPPLRLRRRALEAWAAFDVRFGILRRAPDLDRAFAVGIR
ncbi:MAG TPA: ABC transporter substrate-binding protein [Thermoleophilaceae bacterium]|nr:ABC transporter substrate-binding protein [Thermoleophilaceae bacterium]